MIDEPFNLKLVPATDESCSAGPAGEDPCVQIVPTARQPYEPPIVETRRLRAALSPDVIRERSGENPKD